MANQSFDTIQLLRKVIQGVYADYRFAREAYAAGIAPVARPVSARYPGIPGATTFSYHVLGGRGNELTAVPSPMASNTKHALSEFSVTQKTFELLKYDLTGYFLSNDVISSFVSQALSTEGTGSAGGEMPEDGTERLLVRFLLERANQIHSLIVREEADDQLGAETVDIVDDLFSQRVADIVTDIHLSSGQKPDTILLSPAEVTRIRRLVDLDKDKNLAEVSSQLVRAGYATNADVAAYFLSKHDLQLVVDSNIYNLGTQVVNGETVPGPRAWVWDGQGVIGNARGDLRTLQTFIRTDDSLVSIDVRPSVELSQGGVYVVGETMFHIESQAPETGRVLTFTPDPS